MTHRFDLLFIEQTGKLPGPPIAHVCVKSSFTHEYPGVSPDLVLLTPREYGPEGVIQQIGVLERDLVELKATVRRRYAAWRKREKPK